MFRRRRLRRAVRSLAPGEAGELFRMATQGDIGPEDYDFAIALGERALADAQGDDWLPVREQIEVYLDALKRGDRLKTSRAIILEPFPAGLRAEIESIEVDD